MTCLTSIKTRRLWLHVYRARLRAFHLQALYPRFLFTFDAGALHLHHRAFNTGTQYHRYRLTLGARRHHRRVQK